MPRAAYFDCFSGASGDMLLGAIVDAGVAVDDLRAGLGSLPVAGWSLEAERVTRQGLSGTRLRVRLEDAPQPERHLADVEAILAGGSLPPLVAARASAVFRRLAEAEARVHGTTVDEIHFHEVGAVDAIVDVAGVALGLSLLGVDPDAVYTSGLPLGRGWIESRHCRLPLPAPATAELLRLAGAATRPAPDPDATGELTTPTGAALLTTLAAPGEPTFRVVERVGYGFGGRTFPWPNAVRLWLGEVEAHPPLRDRVAQIETHLDDCTPERLGFAMERLLEAGALDVAFAPLQMKKNRPAVLLRVLGHPERARHLADLVLAHTSALGVRVQVLDRFVAERVERTVPTPWGTVRVKEKWLGGIAEAAPEYEDCARLARDAGVPLAAVYAAALAAAAEDRA